MDRHARRHTHSSSSSTHVNVAPSLRTDWSTALLLLLLLHTQNDCIRARLRALDLDVVEAVTLRKRESCGVSDTSVKRRKKKTTENKRRQFLLVLTLGFGTRSADNTAALLPNHQYRLYIDCIWSRPVYLCTNMFVFGLLKNEKKSARLSFFLFSTVVVIKSRENIRLF